MEKGSRCVLKILDSSVETDEEGGNRTNIANVPAAAALQKKIRVSSVSIFFTFFIG